MKTKSKKIAILSCFCVSVFSSVAGFAQTKSVPPPPKLEKIEEIEDSGITIAKPESAQNSITEKRVAGKVTEVQVQSGKSHYVVKPNAEVGNALKGTTEGHSTHPAQWTLLEFGAKKEVKEASETVPATLPPAPKRTQETSSASK